MMKAAELLTGAERPMVIAGSGIWWDGAWKQLGLFAENGRLPVVTFTAGGIATPADAALCMQLGADGVFVGSGIFKSGNPSDRAKAIVEATTHYTDGEILARVSRGLGDAMSGLSAAALAPEELLETRGW